jgi:ribulose-phosphate 3-epimerase
MTRIAPSILSADYGRLASEVAAVEPGVDLLHVDVMDGHFVPNISIGPPVIKSLRKHTDLYFDCHLMMTDPGSYLEAFKTSGANGCSVHIEAGRTGELISEMQRLDLDVGLAINPDTQLDEYKEFLPSIDMLVIMTVQPGFGGQSFRHDVMAKLRATKDLIDSQGLAVSIEVDGGIDVETAPVAAQHGADTFVAGSAIFAKANPLEAAAQIREAVDAIRKAKP